MKLKILSKQANREYYMIKAYLLLDVNIEFLLILMVNSKENSDLLFHYFC